MNATNADYRSASRQAWSSVAHDWGELISEVDRQLSRAADWMLEAVALQPGETVLDLAGGPGTMSLAARRAVGERGRVIGTDFSEAMIETARARAAEHGVGGIEFRVMDAEAIDLPDGSVDVVLCRMGFMLMADPLAALRESARVLRGGGRLALAVWGEAAANPWATLPMQAIMAHVGAPPPPPDAPGLWALADDARLRALLGEAGLEAVRTEVLDDRVQQPSVNAWLETTSRLAGPVRALVGSLDDQGLAAIRSALEDLSQPYRHGEDGGLALPERMLVALARRP